MADEPQDADKKAEPTKEEAAKAGAVAGASALGCLGMVTLPWSIFGLIVLLFLILWGVHHFFMR